MNPVLLKELRQSVRNRYVLAAYIIFIVVLLIVAGVQTSLAVRESWDNPQSVFRAGKTLFQTVHGIFAALGVLFVPTYVMSRIIRERWGTDLDLMYVTPMPPSALLIGKLGSAMALSGLFLSAALPFLALSYFIGGIDVLTIVMTILLTLEVIAVLTLYAIVVAIAPMPKILRGLAQLGYVGTLVGVTQGWIFATVGLGESGYRSIFADWRTCVTLVESIAAGLSAAALLYAAALAGFRPATSDRMRPFRVLATALFFAWGCVAAFQSQYTYFKGLAEAWAGVLIFFAAGMMVVGLSERAEPGMSLRRQRPRSPMARALGMVLGFPFRTGQLNAVCWAALLLMAGILASYIMPPATPTDEGLDFVRISALNISGYALTLLVLWRCLLRRKGMPCASLWWVTGVAIAIITAILGPMNAGGVDGIDHMVGYVFAENVPLALLYGWNVIALLCLLPILIESGLREGNG